MLNKVSDVKIETDQIEQVVRNEVIKREVLEGVKADDAVRKVNKAAGKLLRKPSAKQEDSGKTEASPSSTTEQEVSS